MTTVAEPKNIKDFAKGRSDLYRVSPYDLSVREGWNSRDDKDPDNIEHIDRLAQSIAQVGVKESLTVKYEDGKLFLTDGHCRRAAAIMAIEKYGAEKDMTVPVKTEGRDATEADMVFSQIVRNSGKPLSPFEQGKVFLRLIELGWDKSNIAQKAGFSKKHVDNLIVLHQTPDTVKQAIARGEVSATMVTQVVNKNRGDVEAAAEDITKAVEKAKSEGKEKATAKDLPTKPTVPTKRKAKDAKGKTVKVKPIDPKKAVRELKSFFSTVEIDEETSENGEIVYAALMSADEWARVKELLAIKATKAEKVARDNKDLL